MLAPEKRNQASPRLLRSFHFAVLLFTLLFTGALSAEELSRKVIAKTAPSYPDLAKRMHVTGKVRLEVVIATDGAVNTARLVGGNPVFERSAVDAVRQWRFEPAQKETKTVIVLEFADQ
jgi:TonB family protein